MHHDLEVSPDADEVAVRAADYVARHARAAVAAQGRFTFAVSGGHTPWAMFAALARQEVPWRQVVLYQVDERVAPDGDPDRNLTHLLASLAGGPATVVPMPVADLDGGGQAAERSGARGHAAGGLRDLVAAAERYGAGLPDRFDLVHLGLGPDGHTASLVPGDPVLEVTDRLVALTGVYQGRRRMTLTYPALARARQLLWLVTGADKKPALGRLLAGDTTIPAGTVVAERSLVLADATAA